MENILVAKVSKGQIVIDMWKYLKELTGEERLRLIETLSCYDDVVRHVGDQIINGMTKSGLHGGKSCGTSGIIDPITPLDKIVRFVVENSSDLADEKINVLEQAIKKTRIETNKKIKAMRIKIHEKDIEIANLKSRIESESK